MFDVLIRGGLVVDGTGRDAYSADVGIRGDRIERIGDLRGEEARQVIDATGKYVTPGFIDPHSHADLLVLLFPTMEAYLQQGVTTVVGGNCGHSLAPMGDEIYRAAVMDMRVQYAASPSYFKSIQFLLPKEASVKAVKEEFGVDMDWHSFGEYLEKCDRTGMDANIAPLVGYSAIRATVMGADCCREATEDELDRIMALTEQCLEEGAFGVSTGMDAQYVPGPFATRSETVRMLKLVKKYDRMFSSHTRSFDLEGNMDRHYGYREMLEPALEVGVRSNVSHMYTTVPGYEEGLEDARRQIAYIEEMEANGLDVTFDVIPSTRSGNGTFPYFSFYLRPFVLMSGSRRQLAKNFTVPDFREMVYLVVNSGMYASLDENRPSSWLNRLCIQRHRCPEYVGKTLKDLTKPGGKLLDTFMDIFSQDCDMGATVEHCDNDDANKLLASHRLCMPCADGGCCTKDTNYGVNEDMTFLPATMNLCYTVKYINEMGKPRFEDTIHQMTEYPAQRFGIKDRGVLREGCFADVVVLDKDNLRADEHYDGTPNDYPDGIDAVLVNGEITVLHKKHTGARKGRMLRYHQQ